MSKVLNLMLFVFLLDLGIDLKSLDTLSFVLHLETFFLLQRASGLNELP